MTTDPHRTRLTAADQWGQDPDTRVKVAPLLTKHKVGWQTVGNCWTRLVLSCTAAGTTDLTADQLAQRAYVTPRAAQRALYVLRDAGVLETVQRGRSPGRGGGPGRGAVRRPILPALPVDNADPAKNDYPLGKNDYPLEGATLRVISPETPPAPFRRDLELPQIGQGGGKEQRKNDHPLVPQVARALVALEPAGSVKNPDGLTRHKAQVVRDTLAGLEGHATWQGWLRHGTRADLVTALASKCRGEPVSQVIAGNLERAVQAAKAAGVA